MYPKFEIDYQVAIFSYKHLNRLLTPAFENIYF